MHLYLIFFSALCPYNEQQSLYTTMTNVPSSYYDYHGRTPPPPQKVKALADVYAYTYSYITRLCIPRQNI